MVVRTDRARRPRAGKCGRLPACLPASPARPACPALPRPALPCPARRPACLPACSALPRPAACRPACPPASLPACLPTGWPAPHNFARATRHARPGHGIRNSTSRLGPPPPPIRKCVLNSRSNASGLYSVTRSSGGLAGRLPGRSPAIRSSPLSHLSGCLAGPPVRPHAPPPERSPTLPFLLF